MAEFLIYNLKVIVLMAVFYFCYRLLMERETMHLLNRIVLLASILLSFVLPLCVITLHETVEVESPQVEASAGMPIQVENQPKQVITELGTTPTEESVTPFVEAIVFAIFIIGLFCRLLYIANSYRHLRRMIKESELHSLEDGVILAVVDLPVAPFSWMRTIVLSRIDYEELNPSIIAHERGHILLHHSWDIVFVEVLTALQWFNPVVWLLRRDLRTIHEYEADASVLSSGSDVSQYIQLLMRKATGTKACILANGINNSIIKKRIIMMLKDKSNRHCWLKVFYVIPVVAISLAVTAKTVTNFSPVHKEIQLSKNNEQQKESDSAVQVKTEQHSNHQFIGYHIQIPIGATFSWDEGKNGKGSEVITTKSPWKDFSVTAKTTVIMLNGKEFNLDNIPYIRTEQIKKVSFTRKNNENPSIVNIITK